MPVADQNATVLGAERPPAAPGSCELSLVVPVYNERDALPGLLDEMERVCTQLGVAWEIVIVDDGSTDGTPELLDRYVSGRSGVSVVRLRRNFGKSEALDRWVRPQLRRDRGHPGWRWPRRTPRSQR